MGFPCTDISISGRMAGLHGERSGLFFTVVGLLKGTAPQDKPRYLIVENVKHLVSSEKGTAFTTVLFELWEAGYDTEWCVVNSKEFGVPQHREREMCIRDRLCTHGPGCRPDFVHSDTIHLRHPVDDDYMAVGRGDVWGIPKPETLEWLATLYPALVEKAALQAETAADEELCR